jgi:anti-sigma factor RsiW
MNHVHEDQLLLLAYGELAEGEAAATERHLAGCAECRARLTKLDRARVAYDWAAPQRRRTPGRWIAAGLVAAAAVLAVVVMRRAPTTSVDRGWPPPAVWSATAGYIAGGTTVVEIDAQLTRLEQERYHGLPH